MDTSLATFLVFVGLWSLVFLLWPSVPKRGRELYWWGLFGVPFWDMLLTTDTPGEREEQIHKLSTQAPAKQEHHLACSTSRNTSLDQSEALQQGAFSPTQRERLLAYRTALHSRSPRPDPLLERRLEFARWLYQHDKISG